MHSLANNGRSGQKSASVWNGKNRNCKRWSNSTIYKTRNSGWEWL